jgi:hypothetical protein
MLLYPHVSPSEWQAKVGIIAPYSGQEHLIKQKLRKMSQFQAYVAETGECPVEVSTVDGFQGRERELIIVSTVRGGRKDSPSVGFLNDSRRLNVAMTRARTNLWVVGNGQMLNNEANWKNDANHLERFFSAITAEKRYFSVSKPAETYFKRYLPTWCKNNPEHLQHDIYLKLNQDPVQHVGAPTNDSELIFSKEDKGKLDKRRRTEEDDEDVEMQNESDVEMDDALQHEGSSRQREGGVDDALDDDMDGIF